MKPQQKKVSMKGTIFFLNLRRKLQMKAMKIQEVFTRQLFLRNASQISQVQFAKLMSYSGSNFSTIETCDIFNQLRAGNTIPLKSLINAYYQVASKIPSSQSIGVNKTVDVKNQTQQLQNKIIKNGYLRLCKFIRETGMEYFQDVDQLGSGYLTKKQFNKLLILTGLNQFRDKDIRNIMIKQIYKYFPNQKMTKADFVKLFKVDLEEIKNKQMQQSPQIKITQPQKKLKQYSAQKPKQPIKEPSKQPIKQPVVQPSKNPTTSQKPFQKLQIPSVPTLPTSPIVPPAPVPQIQKKDSNTSTNSQHNLQQLFNVSQIFPLSHPFYRLGIPQSEQLQYFQTLQNLLQTNRIFADQSNPKTHLGTYKYASQLFGGQKYDIFVMAASVIQREKSRIGLAREIEPKDIMQGQLGDCYLLSSIASIISHYPETIFDKVLFGVNKAHYFVVKLFIDGEWKFIVTDDQFPVQYGKPVFAKPHGREIWVMLIEKCWAKIFGSYKAIQSGTPTQGFRALTGAPSQYMTVQTKQDQIKIQKKLQQAFQKRYVATVSGSKYLQGLSQSEQQKIGLIPSHAYSFLKFLKLSGQTVVKMRNPWGKTVWKGDWSFDSKKWTKQLRNQCNYNSMPDDGSFYIPWDQFLKYFSSFVICKIDPTFLHTSLKLVNKPHKSNYIRIVVNEEGTYNFSVYQQSKRKNRQIKNYQYSSVRLILAKESGNQYQYIASTNKQTSHCVTFQCNLSKGVYISTIKVDWIANPYPIVFNTYGATSLTIQQIPSKIAPIFKSSLIQSYSRKFAGKIKPYTKISLPQAYNQTEISIQRGIGYIRMCNPTNKAFSTTLSMPSMSGLKPIKPSKLPFVFDMAPKTEFVVGFWVSAKGYSYESSQSITYSY